MEINALIFLKIGFCFFNYGMCFLMVKPTSRKSTAQLLLVAWVFCRMLPKETGCSSWHSEENSKKISALRETPLKLSDM